MTTEATAPADTKLDAVIRAIKGRERWVLLAGCALHLGVLATMIVLRVAILWQGGTYYVRVVPVDPRDLLRGDFVVLSYAFSQVPPQGLDDAPDYWSHADRYDGNDVYVTLVPEGDGKHVRADRFTLAAPMKGPYLRGRLEGGGRIEYGIESFFVQEGHGRRYEDAARMGTLTAEIAIAPDGAAALRGLQVGVK